jgi:hypothetical protein
LCFHHWQMHWNENCDREQQPKQMAHYSTKWCTQVPDQINSQWRTVWNHALMVRTCSVKSLDILPIKFLKIWWLSSNCWKDL